MAAKKLAALLGLLSVLACPARAADPPPATAIPFVSVGPFFVLLYDPPTRTNKFLNLQLGFRTDTTASADAISVARSRIQAGLNMKFKQLDPRELRGANGAFLVQDAVRELLAKELPTAVIQEILIEKMLVH